MTYFIGGDLGTSALKLLLIDENGEIIKETVREYAVSYPKPSWSEQHPDEWYNAFLEAVNELLSEVDPKNVRAIGFGGQMHGLVALDKDNCVIRPAILWNDGRTDKENSFLNEVVGKEKLIKHTSNISFAGFTAPKLLWLKNNEPENFNKIQKIMLPKDYINFKLTGVFATDYSDASGTLLLDVENKCWSNEMLKICGVTESQMPKLFESFEVIGTLTQDVASKTGLPKETIVVAGAGDNAAAAIGTNTISNGRCNISLGTSGTVFVSSNSFSPSSNAALHSFCHASGGFHLMACILSAASCNKWFCGEILKTTDYNSEQLKIDEENLGKNNVFFLPYLMGERSPINNTDATGLFVGMRMNTKRKDMLLAVLEGVAFAIRDNLEIAKESGIKIECATLCGGGAKSKLWQKILANVLNIKIILPKTEQGPGYGAAMLAMVGCGKFKNVFDCGEKFFKEKAVVLPESEIANRYNAQYEKFRKIYPAVENLYKEIK